MRLATGRKASKDSMRPIDDRPMPVILRLLVDADSRAIGLPRVPLGWGRESSKPDRKARPRSLRCRRPAIPTAGVTNGRLLDIERPFGMMQAKEARVTKHDAERKVRILDYIAATLRARGYPPSVREIAVAVGLASTSAVHHHLQILEREGYLERGAAQSRAIRLTPNAAIRLGLSSELVPQATTADSRVVPIIGEIAAGGPIEAYQDASESMSVPDMLAPS